MTIYDITKFVFNPSNKFKMNNIIFVYFSLYGLWLVLVGSVNDIGLMNFQNSRRKISQIRPFLKLGPQIQNFCILVYRPITLKDNIEIYYDIS